MAYETASKPNLRCTRHGQLAAAMLCFAALLGCRAKLSVQSHTGPKAAVEKTTGSSIPIPDGFSSNRTFFQSRSTIAVGVSSKVVNAGEHFSLLNETTNAVLVDQQPLDFGLDTPQASLTDKPSFQVTVQFFPLDQDDLGRFVYGVNTLKLIAEGGKTAEQQVTLRDFPVAGMPLAYFESGEQRQTGERGFQGELSSFARSVATKSDGYLVTGMMTIINQ